MRSSPRAESRGGWMGRWGTPSLVLLTAFGLRLFRLGEANLWWDEALAIWAVRKGLLGVTVWTAGDVHPPLYFWSLWAWVQSVGESEFAMRALSLTFGVLTVAVVYSLGSLVGGRETGVLGSLLTALSRFHVWWSQEMRMYILACLMGVLSLYLFLQWLRSEGTGSSLSRIGRRSSALLLVLYVLASACALYTIFLMGAIILAENVVVLITFVRSRSHRRRSLLCRWIKAQVAILLALAVWLVLSWGRMSTWSVSEPLSVRLFARLYATLLTTGVSVDIERYSWTVLFPFVVLMLGGWCLSREWWRQEDERESQITGALALVLALASSSAAIYLASMPRGLFYTPQIEARYFVPFAPAFWVLLGWSTVLIRDRYRTAGWVCGGTLLCLWAVFLPGYYSGRVVRDDLQTMVRTIISQAKEGDAVLLDSGGRFPIFLYYYDQFRDVVKRPPMLTVSEREERVTRQEVARELASIAERYKRIWLAEVDVNLTDPDRLVEKWLSERHDKVLLRRYGHNTLHLYDPEGRPPSLAVNEYGPQHLVDAPVGTGGYLEGWELPVVTFAPGSMIHLSLLWERLPGEPVAVSLRNPAGKLLLRRQGDPTVRRDRQRQQFDFPVYASTPAGRYDIILSPSLSERAKLGSLRITHTRPLPRVGPPESLVGARLNEGIVLVGYTIRDARAKRLETIAAGGCLTLDLYWRADRKPVSDYTVFTHLLGQAHNPKTQGPVWGQHDSQPANDGYPTTQWLVGDVVVDRHLIEVDEGAPPGAYRIEVGMYTLKELRRLKVTAKEGQALGDRILLETPVYVERV